MALPDIITGIFEGLASLFILNNCWAMWSSRQAQGVSLLSTMFFTAWGFWNLIFYPGLDQWFSFYAGIAVVLANLCWVGSIIYLRRNP